MLEAFGGVLSLGFFFYLSEFWVLVALLFFDYNNVVEEKVDKIFSHET